MGRTITSAWCAAGLRLPSKTEPFLRKLRNNLSRRFCFLVCPFVSFAAQNRSRSRGTARVHRRVFAKRARRAKLVRCHSPKRSTILRWTNRRLSGALSSSSRRNPIRRSKRWRKLRARSPCTISGARCGSSPRFIFPTNALTTVDIADFRGTTLSCASR